jgi:hypothetical protein
MQSSGTCAVLSSVLWVLSLMISITSGCMLVFPVPDSGAGCRGEAAGYYPAIDVVRLRAAADFDCAPAAVHVTAKSDTTFSATGCGENDTYSCEADAVSGCDLEEAAERESCQAFDE